MSRNNRPDNVDEAREAMAALVRQLQTMHGAQGGAGDVGGAELLAQLGGFGGHPGMRGAGAAASGLLTKMKNSADEGGQVSALNEFCTDLSMGRGDAFRPSEFIPVLMQCLGAAHNPNISLLAARGLTYFVDNTPRAAEVILQQNYLVQILNTLREISDMELAEQTITCVSNISKIAPQAVLQADGLSAVLGFIDFFSIVTQRTILSIVADVSRKFRKDHMSFIQPVLPQIRNYIATDDNKMAEFALTAMIRMVQNTSSEPDIVFQVFDGSAAALVDVLCKRPTETIFSAALQLLSAAASKSAKVAEELIKLNAVSTLVGIVEPQKSTTGMGTREGSASLGGASSPGKATAGKTLGVDRVKDITKCLLGFAPAVEGEDNILSHVDKVAVLRPSPASVKRQARDAEAHAGLPGHGEEDPIARLMRMRLEAAQQHEMMMDENGELTMDDNDDMDIEDEDDDEEFEDVDDDDVLDEDEVKAIAQQLIADGRIKVDNNLAKHIRSHPGRHLCDACNVTIADTEMWYRCNARPDYDVCARCLIKDEVLDSQNDAVFTQMSSVFPSRRPQPTAASPTSTQPAEDQNAALVRLINESPEMIQFLSAALPCLSRLAIEVEDVDTRHYALDFICRMLHYSSSECLVATLHDTPLCETVTSLISTPCLLVQTRCVFIVRTLIEKLPHIYSNLFIREGVTNGLAVLKSNVSVDARVEASTAVWADRLKHEGSWKAFLASEAADLLVTFAGTDDCGRLSHLETLKTTLDDVSPEAPTLLSQIPDLVGTLQDVSTFELMHSGIVSSLLGALQRADSPPLILLELITRLVAAPAGDDQQGTLLTKLIHMLQSIIAQAEQFKRPSYAKDDKDIILVIKPHDPKELEEQVAVSIARREKLEKIKKKEAKKKNKDSTATAEEAVVEGSSTSSAIGTSNEDTKTLLRELSTNGVPKTVGEAKGGVRIDAQASVEGIANFVQNTLLPNKPEEGGASRSSRSSGASPTERPEDVMNVDPFEGEHSPVASPDGSPASSSAPPLPAPKSNTVYIRYKRIALPLTMTMGAAMKAFITTDPDRELDSSAHNAEMGLGHLNMFMGALSRTREVVQLHYSTEPFTYPTVSNPEIYIKGANPNSPTSATAATGGDIVQYNSESMPTTGSNALKNALAVTSFERSRTLNMPDSLFDTIRFLTVLFDGCTNWESLVRWVVIHKSDIEAWKRYPSPSVPAEEFTSQKLSNKALQHGATKDAVGQQWGTWYIKLALDFPFLFTLTVRKFLMEATFMGAARSMVRIQEYLKENGVRVDNSQSNESSVHRVHRQKVRVKREFPLESAMQVFDKSKASNACVFEFQYDGEVGTGLGPTMEFYSLVGGALQKKKLHLWRDGDEDELAETYLTVEGLYPRPIISDSTDRAELKQFVRHFQFIGRYLARVLLDRRIPNMRFSVPFLKMLRGDELAFDDIAQVSPKIYSLFEAMAVALNKRGDSEGPLELSSLPKPVSVDDLALTFVLPGAEDVPLCENGADMDVTSANASDYLAKVSTALLKDTMQVAAKAVREGFGSVFSLISLKMLTIPELVGIFMGNRDPITIADLDTYVICDHGYISTSKPVRMFFELLSEMSVDKQCQFFQFLTGSPTLPVGGLSALKPQMTIVRKTSGDPNVPEDSQLPSAMTCQNYLKLPAYESKEQMEIKLTQALENGINAFHFS